MTNEGEKLTAAYMRISIDDGLDGENESISNQRLIIRSHIASCPELRGQEITEYIDDGCTGTSFHRPGLSRLLRDMEKEKIGTVIVKDSSRLGRLHLEVSRLREIVFPALQIRFISIGEGYDSNERNFTDLDMQLKSLLNQLYSEDTSYKVRQAVYARVRLGTYYPAKPSYGYRYAGDGNGIKAPLIDEPAAKNVRRIFSLFLDGIPAGKIAGLLNEEGLDPPLVYRKKQEGGEAAVIGHRQVWTYDSVARILRESRYTGTELMLKRAKGPLGSGSVTRLPESRWHELEGRFPPIISREEFERAQSLFRKIRPAKTEKQETLFAGKLFCGYCKRALRLKPYPKHGNRNLICRTPEVSGKFGCPATPLREKDIAQAVLYTLNVYIRVFADISRARYVLDEECRAKSARRKADGRKKVRQQKKAQIEMKALFEAYRRAEHTREEYYRLREVLNRKIQRLETGESEQPGRQAAPPVTDVLKALAATDTLTRCMLERFTARIEVFEGPEIHLKLSSKPPPDMQNPFM